MENPNKLQDLEPGMIQDAEAGTAALLCAPPCNGAVCIPRTRYDELMRAEIELGVLRRAYQTTSSFSIDYIMDNIFDPTTKYKPAPIPGTEAAPAGGSGDAE